MLSHLVSLGEVRSAREFIYVLNAVRLAIDPTFYDCVGSAWDQFKDDRLTSTHLQDIGSRDANAVASCVTG